MPAPNAIDRQGLASSTHVEDRNRRAWLRAAARTAWAAALAGPLAGAAGNARAQGPVAPEAQVKAAYLVKFPGFVEWPATAFRDSASPFVIGWVGAEAVALELAALVQGRRVQGRPADVRAVDLRAAEPAALQDLHVLFVGSGARREAAALIAACRDLPVLVVSEAPWGLAAGAMLNFVLRDGHVRFEAARQPAERVGLKLSARLLAVADRVVEATP